MDNVYLVRKCCTYYTGNIRKHLKEYDELSGIFSTVEKATEALGIQVKQSKIGTVWFTKEVTDEDGVTIYYVINQVKLDQVINR